METHRQRCQGCQSHEMLNILVREPGFPTTIYARCRQCGELVASYKLSDYYHHGKGIESYLRSHGGAAGESGRDVMQGFKDVEEEALTGFQTALEHLQAEGKEL